MSQYSRNERNANAGIVVGITPEADYPGDALAGIAFQRHWESRAFELGGGNYEAPGQLVGDFLAGRASTKLGSVIPSYTPGVHLCDLATALPDYAIAAIKEALPAFDKQIRGFAMHDAVLTGVGKPHFRTYPYHPGRPQLAKPEHPRSIPCRRRRRLCGRYPVGRHRRHQGSRGGGLEPERQIGSGRL